MAGEEGQQRGKLEKGRYLFSAGTGPLRARGWICLNNLMRIWSPFSGWMAINSDQLGSGLHSGRGPGSGIWFPTPSASSTSQIEP